MSKRKYSEIEDRIDAIPDRAIRIKASRLQAKISHGCRSLKDALALARGFERQKMGRRQKQASDTPHTLLRLREEVIVLKELDVAKTANDYLLKQMAKTKRIREAEAFIALFGEHIKVSGPTSTAEANVLGRLFKARPVMEVLPAIMEELRQVLGLDVASSNAIGPQERRAVERSAVRYQSENTADEFTGFSDLPLTKANGPISDDSDLDEVELHLYKNRLTASSDGSDNDGDDNVKDLDPMEISDVDEGQNHDQKSVFPESLHSNDNEEIRSHQKSTTSKVPLKITSTAFLPSLSMSGYYSGSESSDNDRYEASGPALPKDRKNRRGQRARQQLAELKYGLNAKHLQNKMKTQNGSRDVGWDAKRGAVDGHDPRQQQQQRRFAGKGNHAAQKKNGRLQTRTRATGANDEAMGKKRSEGVGRAGESKKRNEGALHPSWEAAKIKKMQESGRAAFAGKKIRFD